MTSTKIVTLLLLLSFGLSIKMTLFLNSQDGGTCFYEQLKQGQKYSVSITTYNQPKCKLDIYKSNQGEWQTIVSKVIEKSFDRISKLSDSQSTYMFCFVNPEQSIEKVTVEIMAGLELANFEHLPDQSDKQGIDQMVNWIETLKNKLLETINRQEGTHSQTVNLKSSSSKTMLILAIVALLFIIGNNVFFYLNAKKQLKDRKLI